METWHLALVVLLALFVGALFPLIFLLTLTFNNVRKQVVTTGKRLDDAIDEIKTGVVDIRLGVNELRETIGRLNTFSQGLEGGEQAIQTAIKAVGELGQTVQGINDSARNYSRIIAMVGPFVSNFIIAMRQNAAEAGTVPDASGDGPEKTEEKP